ncbi:hypothetical protein FRC01_001613 [Tulasnella sp. 417]|nr:hypothetical protein FRC01_001613 [Tulasnella sp. 417]
MLGKSIFARRAARPTPAPSSQFQLESTVSGPSTFGQKVRKFKQVFKRSSPQEKDAHQSIAYPQDVQGTARPEQNSKATTSTQTSQRPYAMTQGDLASFDQRPHGPYLSRPPTLGSSPLFQPEEHTFASSTPSNALRPTSSATPSFFAPSQSAPTTGYSSRSPRLFQPEEESSVTPTLSTTSRPTFSGNSSLLAPPQSAPTTGCSPRSPRLFQPQEEIAAARSPSTTSRPTFSGNSSLLAPPQSAPTTGYSPRSPRLFQPQEEISATPAFSTTSRPKFSGNSSLAPPQSAPTTGYSPRSARLFQHQEEISAARSPSTTSRPKFSGNPSLVPPPQSAPTTGCSPRSPRLFRLQEETSATSTTSTTSRPTFSGNPSLVVTPPQSFDTTPTTVFSHPSPRLQPGRSSPTTSTPSTAPRSTFSPNPSPFLTVPQSARTTPTTVSTPLSPTSQHAGQTVDDLAAAEKIANLRATIQNLRLKRDNYHESVQRYLATTIFPRVDGFQKKRDAQLAELERAKAELAQKTQIRDEMDKLWRDQREERWKLNEQAVELFKKWNAKEKPIEDLCREVERLESQQEEWVERGWRRRDWESDFHPSLIDRPEESAEQPLVGPITWAKQQGFSLSAFGLEDPSAQNSASIEYGGVGETARARGHYDSGVSTEEAFPSRPTCRLLSFGRVDRSEGSLSSGARSTAPPQWARQGLFAAGAGARHRASTQSSDSIEFEMMGATIRPQAPGRTSQRNRGTLGDSRRQSEGSGSRGKSDEYSDDFA